jgi:chemotaxis methyl-accepting protein methylase
VLIYFGEALRERVLVTFTRGLCRGGFFCLGQTERIPEAARANFSEFCPQQRIYRHRGAA